MKSNNTSIGLITLTAVRDRCEQGIYKGFSFTRIFKGRKLFATFPPEQKQPRYGQKTIVLNCWKWNLKWIDANSPTEREKSEMEDYERECNYTVKNQI